MQSLASEFRELRLLSWTLPVIAIATTTFRLSIRTYKRQLWWDDFWAFMASLCFVIFIAAMELHFRDEGSYSYTTKIALYYMLDQFFYAVNWCSKLSILLATVRLAASSKFRRSLFYAACAFACAWAVLFAQVFWVCENQPGWKDTPQPQCDLGKDVAIAQVITDVVTDVILVTAPLRLVWKVKLSRPQKIRILAMFSSTSIATAVSLYHAYAILKFGGFEEARAAVIQDGVTLIVVDLGVVVTFFMRISSVEDSSRRKGYSIELSRFRNSQKTTNPMSVNVDTTTLTYNDFNENVNMVKFTEHSSKPDHIGDEVIKSGAPAFDDAI